MSMEFDEFKFWIDSLESYAKRLEEEIKKKKEE